MPYISLSSPTHIVRYNMPASFPTFGLVVLELVDDEVHGVENIALELVVGVVFEVSAAVFGDSLADEGLHCFFLHA